MSQAIKLNLDIEEKKTGEEKTRADKALVKMSTNCDYVEMCFGCMKL